MLICNSLLNITLIQSSRFYDPFSVANCKILFFCFNSCTVFLFGFSVCIFILLIFYNYVTNIDSLLICFSQLFLFSYLFYFHTFSLFITSCFVFFIWKLWHLIYFFSFYRLLIFLILSPNFKYS